MYGMVSVCTHRLARPAFRKSGILRDAPPVTMCTSPPGRYQYQTGTRNGARPRSLSIASIATCVSARNASRCGRVIA